MKEQEEPYRKIISVVARPRELTKQERDVVKLVAEGFRNREVVERLGVAVKTVRPTARIS